VIPVPDEKGPEAEILARIKKISQELQKLQRDFRGEIRRPWRERTISGDKAKRSRKER